jgi:L-ascorbate metabolism protein UlaG (beta-lactamase superfamily)
MKLVKREHACLVLSQGSDTLIVDPGSFTLPLEDVTGVVAIVITHEHPDHWTPEHLDRIMAANSDARIFGPAGLAAAAHGYDVTVVADGDTVEVGEFTLAFYGEKHAVIHSSIPVIDNVGVLVNGALWYGGDSYTVPPVPVETVAVPAGAPWLKIGEVMDYVDALAPKRTFPTHEMVLSVIGKGMANQRIASITESHGGEHFALEPGESLDL